MTDSFPSNQRRRRALEEQWLMPQHDYLTDLKSDCKVANTTSLLSLMIVFEACDFHPRNRRRYTMSSHYFFSHCFNYHYLKYINIHQIGNPFFFFFPSKFLYVSYRNIFTTSLSLALFLTQNCIAL